VHRTAVTAFEGTINSKSLPPEQQLQFKSCHWWVNILSSQYTQYSLAR